MFVDSDFRVVATRYLQRRVSEERVTCGELNQSVPRRLVGVIKRSTVSTAQLKAFLPLHLRPINLVVFQGSLVLRHACLVFRGASRLDAFSVYPCRA